MKWIDNFLKFNESFKNESILDNIKNLKKIPKEYKYTALDLVKSYTKVVNGKITGLILHPKLKEKIDNGGYPNGFDMGIDSNGYFIHTHRARSKSHKDPSSISVKEIKFIDSTG